MIHALEIEQAGLKRAKSFPAALCCQESGCVMVTG